MNFSTENSALELIDFLMCCCFLLDHHVMMFWFRRFFLRRTSKQLLCDWILPALGPKNVKQMHGVSSTPDDYEKIRSRVRRKRCRRQSMRLEHSWTCSPFSAIIIKQGKINYLHFLNILIECLNGKMSRIFLSCAFWYILRWFSAILTHRWIFWVSLMQEVDAGGVSKWGLKKLSNIYFIFPYFEIKKVSHKT